MVDNIGGMVGDDGRVDGGSLLVWLRSHEKREDERAGACNLRGDKFLYGVAAGRASLLGVMADDLERGLNNTGENNGRHR